MIFFLWGVVVSYSIEEGCRGKSYKSYQSDNTDVSSCYEVYAGDNGQYNHEGS